MFTHLFNVQRIGKVTCPKVFHKGHSRIANSTLHEQTSETRTQDTRTSRPHPRFMPLSQNITRIHSLYHPKFPVFMSSRTRGHTWSHLVTRGHTWSHLVTRGHTLRLCQEKCSTTHRLHFLINRIVKPCNSLYPDIISSTTHSRFKACISNTDLTKYLTI